MKANEAKSKFVYPDKLYARCKDNKTLDISYAPQTMEAVEYVRTDAFVEKAAKWLDETLRIRTEIERRYKYNKEHENDWAGTSHFWQRKEDEEILSFIDSMQEECGVKTFYGIPTNNIPAWLEKQGEPKPQNNQNANIEWGFDPITGDMHFNNLTLEQAEELRNALLGKHWKPSEEELNTLDRAWSGEELCQYDRGILNTLFSKLKSL